MDVTFTKKPTSPAVDIISSLLHSRTQIHIFHLQSTTYADHMALGGYYTEIGDLIDSLVETIQGKEKALIKGYKAGILSDYAGTSSAISFFSALAQKLETYRVSLSKSWANIDNQIQVIIDLIESTIYKLTFLK